MSSSTNMTVEDRLAEKLKAAEFAQWFGEDDLRELVAKAIDKAFFAERTDDRGGYNRVKLPSLVVEVATQHVAAKLDQLVISAVKEKLAEHPEMLEAIVTKAVAGGVEEMLQRAILRLISSAFSMQEFNIQNRVREMLQAAAR